MVKTKMIRINQKSLSSSALENIYSAFEGEDITIKRVFDHRFSFSGDDLIIEGDLDNFYPKILEDSLNIVSLRFQLELGDYENLLENFSAMNLKHEHKHYFFATTLVDYNYISTRLRLSEKEKILALLFRSLLGSKFASLMPVKIKGVTVYNETNHSVCFVLPSQRIETLKQWLYTIPIKETMDFDALVDIFKQTDPEMRKKLEDTLDWISNQLPELVAKSTTVEDINILNAYRSSFKLVL
ncbi:MAG: hypothetical protein ACTSQE_00445 [Candidatus Heimdallarchaeaceae archaeon]